MGKHSIVIAVINTGFFLSLSTCLAQLHSLRYPMPYCVTLYRQFLIQNFVLFVLKEVGLLYKAFLYILQALSLVLY